MANETPLKCDEHSGCLADITHLQDSDKKQWDEMKSLRDRLDTIFNRLNYALVGIAVAVLMMLVNILMNGHG